MNAKQISILVVTIAVIATAWNITTQKAPQTEVERGLLYPLLLENANNVDTIELRSKTDITRLQRVDDRWLLTNKDNFVANSALVRKLLLQIAALKTVEPKTSTPDRYLRIGVADIESNDVGTQVLAKAGDQDAVGLIVGNAREASSKTQTYVRRIGEAQSWLVEGELEVAADPIRWLDALIVDIDSERITEVEIVAGDETPIRIKKKEQDDSFFELQDIPAGYEAKSKTIISSMGALLLDLRFNDVAAASRIADQQATRTITLKTSDGIIAKLDEYPLDDQTFARFAFSLERTADGTTEVSDAADAEAESDAEESETASLTPAQQVEQLVARTNDWIYVLPKYKRRMIDRKFDSLIKEIESEEDT